MEKISVIIPVYNAEKYLSRCLESVINQTYKNLEIICINDKSTDNSAKILEEYSQDSRIIVLNNENNQGSAISRNNGLDIATGDYVYFIDADDYIEKKYLEVMLNKEKDVNCDIVLNLSVYNNKNGEESPYNCYSLKINEQGEYVDKYKIITDAPDIIWARLYKKSLLDKFRFKNIFSDDVFFNTIAAIYSDRTYVFYGEKYHYTIHSESMTETATAKNIWDLEHFRAYNQIYEYLQENKLYNDGIKLFKANPSEYSVDTPEKLDFYKMFFEKIKEKYYKNREIYSDFEKAFAESIIAAKDFDDYKNNCNKMVRIFKLIDRKNYL